MELQLKSDLKHQQYAIAALNYVFKDIEIDYTGSINSNPVINTNDPQIEQNILKIQNGEHLEVARKVPFDWRTKSKKSEILNIDIRMETGTGKTYVYTKMMYELHKNYGFNKFIILVPSTAIREGTKQFIISDYAKKHFVDDYKNVRISLNILSAQKKQKKKKKMFPIAVSSFVRTTRLEKNNISVLLVNDAMLLSKATMEKSDYDQTLLGNFTQPYAALEETKSIVIIDEPHRFKKDNKAYKCIVEKIKPQAIIRFGATFPELKGGVKDYDNLIYNLGSCESFNDRLVKGVEIEFLPEIDETDVPVRFVDIVKDPMRVVLRNEVTKKKYILEKGVSLSEINEKFNNIFVGDIGKINDIPNALELSNGQILKKNDIFYANVYSATYQELMISLALDEHFAKERENFMRKNKIKTLALFFIDSVYSFRGYDNNGELRKSIERILQEKMTKIVAGLDKEIAEGKRLREYRAYIQASLDDIRATNDGYFSDDNGTSDDDIRMKIDMILSDKEKLLSIKNDDGTYNTFRFIFSKWALREGWDNPNVFTIAKLRSSGSDISKIQEVGRGLRLPVDELGNRIENEQFYLSYIIDYSEKDFAKRLKDEINSEVGDIANIKDQITEVAKAHNITEKQLFIELYSDDIIDTDYNVIDGAKEKLLEKYPEFLRGLQKGKIVNKNKGKRPTVNIRKNRYNELKELWQVLNQKYYMKFDEIPDDELIKVITGILNEDIHSTDVVATVKLRTEIVDGKVELINGKKRSYSLDTKIPYNEFLKRIQRRTNLPIQMFHQAMVVYSKNNSVDDSWFTESTLGKFIQKFHEWEQNYFIHRFSYKKLNVDTVETALSHSNGDVKESIVQTDLGIFSSPDDISDKFLYDKLIYDSELEKINITVSDIPEVVVYGKIPKRSIKIPVCWGGTYSPDFMYVIKNDKGYLEYNFIIETKGVSSDGNLRDDEKKRILCGIEFFKQLKTEGYNVTFQEQLKTDNIVAMIKKLCQ